MLELTVRWTRGLDEAHGDAVLSGTAAMRASYELYLKRKTQLARERKRSVGQNDDAAETDTDMDQDQWVEDDGTGQSRRVQGRRRTEGRTVAGTSPGSRTPKLNSLAHAKRKVDKMRFTQGGTARWLKHGVVLAKRKVQAMNKHNVAAPAPEQEIQSAL